MTVVGLEPRVVIYELEPWLDKHQLAEYLSCSVRWIATQMAAGMPHSVIAGKVKFKVTIVEPWLEARGLISHRGDQDAA